MEFHILKNLIESRGSWCIIILKKLKEYQTLSVLHFEEAEESGSHCTLYFEEVWRHRCSIFGRSCKNLSAPGVLYFEAVERISGDWYLII